MQSVIDIMAFVLNMATQFFQFMFSSWVLALFPIGMIIVFVMNLVIQSSSGDDSNK